MSLNGRDSGNEGKEMRRMLMQRTRSAARLSVPPPGG